MITKNKNKVTVRLTSSILLLTSYIFMACASEFDNDYSMEKPASVVETEQLNSYGTLLQYIEPSFRLGNTLTAAVFQQNGTVTTQTMTNFNELTISDAFLHARLVANDGAIDTTAINTLADFAQEKGIGIFGTALVSNANNNVSWLGSLIADDLVMLPETTGQDVWNFEGDELGTTYEVKKASGDVKGNAVVEDDPDGVSGHVLHVSKTNQSFPAVQITFPEGRKLGDYQRLVIDYRAINKTALNQVLVLIMAGKVVDQQKPTDYGCELGAWGRGVIVIDLGKMGFSDDQLAKTDIELQIGPKLVNAEYMIDNITLEYTYQPSYYEAKTPEQKQQILSDEQKRYTAKVVGQRSSLDTWIIADHPVTSDEENIWKSNMDEAYFAPAAITARQTNSAVKLFVSEQVTDIETAQALTAIIQKVEAAGAKIDGISIDVALDTDTFTADDLSTVLTALSASGKQIRLNILSFTADTDVNAAKLLAAAVGAYMKLPTAQRYGVSFAAVNESATNAGLWTSGYNRKQAYASLADALK